MTAKTKPECVRCRRPADATICGDCAGLYEQACADLIVLLPHLETAVIGQENVSMGVVHGVDRSLELAAVETKEAAKIPAYLRSKQGRITLPSTALPVNEDASRLLATTRRDLTGWAWYLAGAHKVGDPAGVELFHGPVCAAHAHAKPDPGCRSAGGACKHMHPDHVHRPARPGCTPDCRRHHCGHGSCKAIRQRPENRDASLARWLMARTPQVRVDPQAGPIVTNVLGARRRIEAAIDSRQPEVYVGPCDVEEDVTQLVEQDGILTIATPERRICGAHLFAHFGDTEVTCQACGYIYQVEDRRAWMLEAVRNVWARPALIASALTGMQIELTAKRLDDWIYRDKRRHKRCPAGGGCGCILQVGIDSDDVDGQGKPLGKPMYRIGDVLDRLDRIRATEQARAVGP